MKLNISAIYRITTIHNSKIYIGSAVNIRTRWKYHRRDLRRNKHHSKYLQRVYNKYGENNLKYEILLQCPKEYLIKLEQWFLNNLIPWNTVIGYNTNKIANSTLGTKRSQEFRERASVIQQNRTWSTAMSEEGKKRLSELKKGKPHPKSKELLEKIKTKWNIDEKNILIKQDLLNNISSTEIRKNRNVHHRLIQKNRKELCIKGIYTIEREDGLRFYTEKEACEYMRLSKGCIVNCMKGNWKAGGYYWKKIKIIAYESENIKSS